MRIGILRSIIVILTRRQWVGQRLATGDAQVGCAVSKDDARHEVSCLALGLGKGHPRQRRAKGWRYARNIRQFIPRCLASLSSLLGGPDAVVGLRHNEEKAIGM